MGGQYSVGIDEYDIDKSFLKRKNFEHDFLFITDNLDHFIKNIKSNDIVINQGVQSSRGKINSLSMFLGHLDMDIRMAMSKHYCYNIPINERTLTNKNFSFKNIHMKSNNTRFYSTNTFVFK